MKLYVSPYNRSSSTLVFEGGGGIIQFFIKIRSWPKVFTL
jgi:hypothetical protein